MEDLVVAEIISGIKQIGPVYPVKPVQPAPKDRKPGEKNKRDDSKQPPPEADGEDKPTIDEHV